MKKIKLAEKDLQRIVKRVIKEHNDNEEKWTKEYGYKATLTKHKLIV